MTSRYILLFVCTVLTVVSIAVVDFNRREARWKYYASLMSALFLVAIWVINIYLCAKNLPL